MNISDQGLLLIKMREGSRTHAYLDTKGIPTIGVGHTAGVQMGDCITDEQVLDLLREDIAIVEVAINSLVTVQLTQNQFDALCSFIFNVGVNAFKNSTLLRRLNFQDYMGASQAFDMWHIPPEITSRRNSEKAQFLS